MCDAIFIRHAVEPDLVEILAIEHQATTAAHWAREVYEDIVAAGANAQPQRALFVAEWAGKVVGFAVAQAISISGKTFECELENIVVLDDARRAGVGSKLLEGVCNWARALGAVELHAEVRESNLPAHEFYARAGFAQTASRRSYYRDPVENARLLALHL